MGFAAGIAPPEPSLDNRQVHVILLAGYALESGILLGWRPGLQAGCDRVQIRGEMGNGKDIVPVQHLLGCT
jgi:hypothetical protein